MRRFLTVIAILTLLALVVAGAAGCGKAAERAVEEALEGASGSEIDVDEDGDSVTITSEGEDGGEMTITGGDSAEVPEEYPDDFPLYEGDITGTSSLTTAEGSMVTVAVMTTDNDFDAIKADIEADLQSNGWTVLFQTDVSDSGMRTAGYTVEKGDRNGNISITEEAEGIIVSHTVLTSTE